jgi:hypothetical protein
MMLAMLVHLCLSDTLRRLDIHASGLQQCVFDVVNIPDSISVIPVLDARRLQLQKALSNC